MTDIYDIKGIVLGYIFDIKYSFIYILFLIVLYILWFLMNKNKNNIKQENIVKKVVKIDFDKLLDDINQKYLSSDKNLFYTKLTNFLRELLEYKGYKDISKMTFDEISRLDINNNIKYILKNIYFKEYQKEIIDNKKLRESYINDIRKLINK
ncbi:hypothetical protein LRZ95_01795 [Candidatus Gracilibacteria bacterium]|nr:hypothetical protein [Candidatus Gracilibacteria bacterium]